MRTAKDNTSLPKRYYRPQLRRCPHCQWKLKRWCTLWSKVLITLDDRAQVFSQGYRCSNPACPRPEAVYRSAEAEALNLPECSFGVDVVVEVGYQRFWMRRTVLEIHASLKERIPISQRHILNLLGNFLALLRTAQPAKVTNLRPQWEEMGGLILSIDGMQPEKGNPALYVVRETQLDETLTAEILTSGDHKTIKTKLLEPIKQLGIPIRGVVSDAQEPIRLAVEQALPGVPHQNCQYHCLREAGRPTFLADRAMKTDLKQKLRGRLATARQAIRRLPDDSPYRPVLLKYARYIRFTLLEGGTLPFDLGGLRMFDDLAAIEASLRRTREKGGIGCLIDLSRSWASVSFSAPKLRAWSVNYSGSLIYSDCLTQ
jgi:hypothetical protein